MKKTKAAPILFTDDVSQETEQEKRSQAVKTCAVRLAQRLATSIELVHVENLAFYPVATPAYKPLIESYFAQLKTQLGELAESVQVPARVKFLNGDPVKTILGLGAKRGAYELIVVGTHGRTGIARLVLGSIAEEIIRGAAIPVLTVGPKAQTASVQFLASPGRVKILVPTGLTPNSDRAELYALSLAQRIGADLVLCHGLHDSLHPVLRTALATSSGAREMNTLLEGHKADATKRLKAKAAKLTRKGVAVSFSIDDKTVSATEVVLKEAGKSGASLIVKGTHGRTLATGAFFGRTARGVILEATVPVITVRSRKA